MKPWTNVVVAATLGLLSGAAPAQTWPTQPVRVLIGFVAGGGYIDATTRLTAAEMSKRLGVSVLVENRPGAGGYVAAKAVSTAPPDGYMILSGTVVNFLLRKEPLVMGKDFSPIGEIASASHTLMVSGRLGIKTFEQLVAYAKANPNKLNFGSVSPTIDFMADDLRRKTGLSYTPIQYKSGPNKELIAGEIDFYIGASGGHAAHFKSGQIVPVLVWAKPASYPEIPSTVELGLMSSPIRSTIGFNGPGALPPAIVQRFSQALLAASKSPELIDMFHKSEIDVYYSTPEQQLRDYNYLGEFYTRAARAANYVPTE